MPKSEARAVKFAHEYVIDLNGTRAAIAAGYSRNGADAIASRLLGNVKVNRLVNRLFAERSERCKVRSDMVLQELAKMAFFDVRQLFDEQGAFREIHTLPAEVAASIAGFEVATLFEHFAPGQSRPIGTVRKIKLADKGLALERLGRHLKLFTDKIELSGDAELLARLTAGRRRIGAKQT